MRSVLFSLFAMLASASGWAQTVSVATSEITKFADPGKAAALPASGVSSMGQVTLALLLVLAVLFAAAWGMRRFKLFGRDGQAAMQVVQGINLGPKERAVLISVQGHRLLLGVAPGCVNLLLELPAEPAVEPGSESDVAGTASGAPSINVNAPDFKTLLKRSMGLS